MQKIVRQKSKLLCSYATVCAEEEKGFEVAMPNTVIDVGAMVILIYLKSTNREMQPSMWQWEVLGGL